MAQCILKRALEQHANDMFLVLLRAVEITDSLRRTAGDLAGFRNVYRSLIEAFPLELLLGLRHPFRRWTCTTDGDLYIVDGSSALLNLERNGNANAGSFQITKFKVSDTGISSRHWHSDLRQYFIWFHARLISIDKKFFRRNFAFRTGSLRNHRRAQRQ